LGPALERVELVAEILYPDGKFLDRSVRGIKPDRVRNQVLQGLANGLYDGLLCSQDCGQHRVEDGFSTR
jgi:hypothetical protein